MNRRWHPEAGDILARLGPGEERQLALAAISLMIAEDVSIGSAPHREQIRGMVRDAAPTFGRALDNLLALAQQVSARRSTFQSRKPG